MVLSHPPQAFLRDVVDKHADRSDAFNLADLFSSISAAEAEKIWASLLALTKAQLDSVVQAGEEDGVDGDASASTIASSDTARNVLKAVTGIARLYLKTMAAPPGKKGKARAAAAAPAAVPRSLTALTVALHDIILELGEVPGWDAVQTGIARLCEAWWLGDYPSRHMVVNQLVPLLLIHSLYEGATEAVRVSA